MMERYFFAEQDRQVRDCIRLEGFDLVNGSRRVMSTQERDTVNEATFLYVKKGPEETVLDFYQSPTIMVSALVREVFSMYEDEIAFKKVYLVDLGRDHPQGGGFVSGSMPLSGRQGEKSDPGPREVPGTSCFFPGGQHDQKAGAQPGRGGKPAAAPYGRDEVSGGGGKLDGRFRG